MDYLHFAVIFYGVLTTIFGAWLTIFPVACVGAFMIFVGVMYFLVTMPKHD